MTELGDTPDSLSVRHRADTDGQTSIHTHTENVLCSHNTDCSHLDDYIFGFQILRYSFVGFLLFDIIYSFCPSVVGYSDVIIFACYIYNLSNFKDVKMIMRKMRNNNNKKQSCGFLNKILHLFFRQGVCRRGRGHQMITDI